MLISIGEDSTARSGRDGRRPACGPLAGAGAAQTRQIAHLEPRDRGISHLVLPTVALVPPPAIVSPRPREVSFGRIQGRVAPGTREILVRVDGRLVATKIVHRRRFALVVSLPSRNVTLRITAVARSGRRSSTLVRPVFGLPRETAPYAGPVPPLRGYEDAALAQTVRGFARAFPGVCGLFVQDLRTGAGAAWNARARFPGASTLKLAIAIELMRELRGVPAPSTRLAALLWKMLVYSDDRAANDLLVTLGGSISGGSARVNAMMRALRLADSEMYGGYIVEDQLDRRPIPLEILGRPYFIGKYSTAWDLARLERALHLAAGARGALIWRFRGGVTPADARYLLYLLANARTRGGLSRYLRGDATVVHKAGWTSKVRHDTGLVYSRRGPFVITVLTWNGRGVGESSDVLAGRVARAAFERFGP
jgi:beta-lactamase class A